MTVVRTHLSKSFTIISNEILQNKEMSFEEIGFLAHCLSKPPEWKFNPTAIWNQGKVGKNKVYHLFGSLIELGYCIKTTHKNTGSRGGVNNLNAEVIYDIYDSVAKCKEDAQKMIDEGFKVEYIGNLKKFLRHPSFRDPGKRELIKDRPRKSTDKKAAAREAPPPTPPPKTIAAASLERIEKEERLTRSEKDYIILDVQRYNVSDERLEEILTWAFDPGKVVNSHIAIIRKALKSPEMKLTFSKAQAQRQKEKEKMALIAANEEYAKHVYREVQRKHKGATPFSFKTGSILLPARKTSRFKNEFHLGFSEPTFKKDLDESIKERFDLS